MGLNPYLLTPKVEDIVENYVLLCQKCSENIENPQENIAHWDCLNDAAWNAEPAVQVMVYRLLNNLSTEAWANNLKEQMYLDDATLEWANHASDTVKHFDANGMLLSNGDSVVLIKDLDVKGANFVAKRGTTVKRIRLIPENVDQLEGKVNDQQIVILCQYVKKA
jgi:protein PhnA